MTNREPTTWFMLHGIGWFTMLADDKPYADAEWLVCRDVSLQIDWPLLSNGHALRQINFTIVYAQELETDVPEYQAPRSDLDWPSANIFALQPVAMEMTPEEFAADAIHRALALTRLLSQKWKLDPRGLDGVILPPKPDRTAFFGYKRRTPRK